MKRIEDPNLIEALESAILRKDKKPEYIAESNNLYHFYFKNTSFSYTKGDIIKLLFKDKHV